ncbi:MAG: hypothetical protein ACLU38_07845 [Dysosmobacter sp.]
MPNGCLVIAMCDGGAGALQRGAGPGYLADSAAQGASHIVFLIGSSFGMHESLKRQAACGCPCPP